MTGFGRVGRIGVVLSRVSFCWRRYALAQDAGIAGVVKDNTGAILPGVTVTAASPVLIEQQRTAVTDAEGRYAITQLRPGVIHRDIQPAGFATVVREGIRLSAGFTANVEGELRVGGIAETITVTGASPVVDVTNVRRQTVVTSELLEALPISTKSVGSLATLTTGLTGLGDVGGHIRSSRATTSCREAARSMASRAPRCRSTAWAWRTAPATAATS